jgi:hypothetical protein
MAESDSPDLQYVKAQKLLLKKSKIYNEDWVKSRIEENPSILGLGNLNLITRERRQKSGGRVDFYFQDEDTDILYEIEVQLGKTDESHIIRTVEYWDLERKKSPTYDHRAVIVAEEITNRFFNVIALFNQFIPIIAIQLNALIFEDKIILDFQKVLDTTEAPTNEIEELEELTQPGDYPWKEDEKYKDSVNLMDRYIQMIKGQFAQVTSKEHKVQKSLATSQIFAWLHFRKKAYFNIAQRILETDIERTRDMLEQINISPNYGKGNGDVRYLSYPIYQRNLDENSEELMNLIEISLNSLD